MASKGYQQPQCDCGNVLSAIVKVSLVTSIRLDGKLKTVKTTPNSFDAYELKCVGNLGFACGRSYEIRRDLEGRILRGDYIMR